MPIFGEIRLFRLRDTIALPIFSPRPEEERVRGLVSGRKRVARILMEPPVAFPQP
jgi:hypothetical protein